MGVWIVLGAVGGATLMMLVLGLCAAAKNGDEQTLTGHAYDAGFEDGIRATREDAP